MKKPQQYGQGRVIPLKSGRWAAQFWNAPKNRYDTIGIFALHEEAERARAAALVARERLTVARGVTWAEYGSVVHERHYQLVREAGGDTDRYALRNDLNRWDYWMRRKWPHGKLPVESMDRAQFKELARFLLTNLGGRGTPPKNRSIYNIWILARRVAVAAVDDGLWTVNHMSDMKPPQRLGENVEGANPLTPREMISVLTCPMYHAHQRCAFGLATYSGIRAGEMASLLHTDFHSVYDDNCTCLLDPEDKLTPHVMITKSWDRPAPKNGQNRRVWLCNDAIEFILAWREYLSQLPVASKRHNKKSPRFWGRKYARGYDWGWADKNDEKRGVYYLGCKRQAGILRPVSEHQLRDTHASHLISGTFGRRWSAEEVAKQLGHSSTWVTERYGTLLDRAMALAIRETPGLSGKHAEPQLAAVIQLPVHHKQSAVLPIDGGRATIARQLLASYDAAKGGLSDAVADEIERAALQLADSILDAEDVRLAHRIIAKDRLMLTHGVELARLLMRTVDGQEDVAPSAMGEVLSLRSSGRFASGHDPRRWNKGGTPRG